MLPPVDLVLLDRDGTIVRVPEGCRYLYGDMRIEWLPGAAEFIRYWNDLDVPVVVVTNQQGVALADYPDMTMTSVTRFHERLNVELSGSRAKIDLFLVCPHHADAKCKCRKPAPGLVLRAIEQFAANPNRTWLIGDSTADIVAGQRAGTNTILLGNSAHWDVRTGHAAVDFDECMQIMRQL